MISICCEWFRLSGLCLQYMVTGVLDINSLLYVDSQYMVSSYAYYISLCEES